MGFYVLSLKRGTSGNDAIVKFVLLKAPLHRSIIAALPISRKKNKQEQNADIELFFGSCKSCFTSDNVEMLQELVLSERYKNNPDLLLFST